jgi:hypothetical protein
VAIDFAVLKKADVDELETFKTVDALAEELLRYLEQPNIEQQIRRRHASIVNGQFLGGEVYARPDHLAQWKFPFDFDKLLLFSRERAGTGAVIE